MALLIMGGQSGLRNSSSIIPAIKQETVSILHKLPTTLWPCHSKCYVAGDDLTYMEKHCRYGQMPHSQPEDGLFVESASGLILVRMIHFLMCCLYDIAWLSIFTVAGSSSAGLTQQSLWLTRRQGLGRVAMECAIMCALRLVNSFMLLHPEHEVLATMRPFHPFHQRILGSYIVKHTHPRPGGPFLATESVSRAPNPYW